MCVPPTRLRCSGSCWQGRGPALACIRALRALCSVHAHICACMPGPACVCSPNQSKQCLLGWLLPMYYSLCCFPMLQRTASSCSMSVRCPLNCGPQVQSTCPLRCVCVCVCVCDCVCVCCGGLCLHALKTCWVCVHRVLGMCVLQQHVGRGEVTNDMGLTAPTTWHTHRMLCTRTHIHKCAQSLHPARTHTSLMCARRWGR